MAEPDVISEAPTSAVIQASHQFALYATAAPQSGSSGTSWQRANPTSVAQPWNSL